MPPLLHHLVLVAGLVFVVCQCVVFGLWMCTSLAAEGHVPHLVLGLLVTGGVVLAWHLTPLEVLNRHHTPAPGALHIVLQDDRPHRGAQRAVPPEPHGRGHRETTRGARP
jgi:hypothetical protein